MARTVLCGDQIKNSSITGADLDTTGSYTMGELNIAEYIYHNGDTDTFIRFEEDEINIKAGNINFINITEATQDKITFNDGGGDVDFIVQSPNESKAIYINAANEVLHINHGESNFQTKIHSTNGTALIVDSTGVVFNEDGAAANDFRVESDGEDEALFVDASSNSLYINKGATGFTTVIKNNNEEVIRVGAAGLIINEYGHASNDLRVESDTDTHMFFVDSSADKIGIGTSSPDCTLNVAGALAASGPSKTFQTFANGDFTPSLANGNLFKTYDATYQGATSFDDGVAGQIVTIISTNDFTYMVSAGNLKGGTTDITTAATDVTTWIYDGTYWYLMNFMDQSADLSGGH